jgi:LysM repeat protein
MTLCRGLFALVAAVAIVGACRTTSSLAEPPPSEDAHPAVDPDTHIVRRGESLWEIARKRLGTGGRVREILEANPGLNPARLQVGQILRLRPPVPLAATPAVGRIEAPEVDSPLDVAWRNLANWPGMADRRHEGLREDILATDRLEGTSARRRRMLLPAQDGDGCLLIAPHVGWKVVFASLSPSLEVRQVEVLHAKCGYSVSWPGELVVTLHRHPGTGMFYDDPKQVSVVGGRISISALGGDSEFRPPSLQGRSESAEEYPEQRGVKPVR